MVSVQDTVQGAPADGKSSMKAAVPATSADTDEQNASNVSATSATSNTTAEERSSYARAATAHQAVSDLGGKRPIGRINETLRYKIYTTFEDPAYSPLAKYLSIFMMFVILLSTTCFILESEAENENGMIAAEPALTIFNIIEWISVCLFTIEYMARLTCCPKPLKFLRETMNMIDLAAWLPFWLLLPTGGGASFGFVRAVRLIRVFRVFKFGKYSMGIQMFTGALKNSVQPMGILVVIVSIAMVIISSIMYMLEMGADEGLLAVAGSDKDHQAYCFGTIPTAFWWAIVTMTTVGYGDCYPSTVGGRALSVFAMLGGVLILALPITVVGSNFQKMVDLFEEDSKTYSLTDSDHSGFIDEYELREFVLHKRKEGRLRKDVDTRVRTLLEKYDPEGSGVLSMIDFKQMCEDCIIEDAVDPAKQLNEVYNLIKTTQADAELTQSQSDERLGRLETAVEELARHAAAMQGGAVMPAQGGSARPMGTGTSITRSNSAISSNPSS